MIELPDECPNTLEHALVHVDSAYKAVNNDKDQVRHDLGIAEAIIKNLQELEAEAPELEPVE